MKRNVKGYLPLPSGEGRGECEVEGNAALTLTLSQWERGPSNTPFRSLHQHLVAVLNLKTL
jgi:hypothetical protein